MRVVAISPAYPPVAGGVSDCVRRWSHALADRGVEMVVLTSPGLSDDHPGVRLVATQADWGPSGMRALKETLRELRPDVVVVHYVPHLYEFHGASIAINTTIPAIGRDIAPVVTFAHELYYGRHEGWRVQPMGWLQRLMLWPMLAGSAKVVLTVPDRMARLTRVFAPYAKRLVLLPIGDNLLAGTPAEGQAWRAAQGIATDELALLFLGLAHPSKEMPSLARALDVLQAAGVKARLLLGGGGKLEHPLALVLGFLSPAQAGAALAGADMFLVPYEDGASTRRSSIMNALAAGLPIVTTRGVNTEPGLFDAATRLVAAGDAEAFASAVLALAQDAEARRALGAAGKALHAEQFAWDVLASRWQPLLEEVVRGRVSGDGGSPASRPPAA